MQKLIKVKDFSDYLVNRNRLQGDGTKTAIEFRENFLADLERDAWWADPSESLVLDFREVRTLGPSWANEAFAYYTSKRSPSEMKSKIKFENLSEVKREIIELEIESGYATSIKA